MQIIIIHGYHKDPLYNNDVLTQWNVQIDYGMLQEKQSNHHLYNIKSIKHDSTCIIGKT